MNLERVIAVRTGKTVYRDGDRVIKLFDRDYRKADVLNEALNHARAEETGLMVPRLYEVGILDGRQYIMTEYIAGKTLARLMDEQPERRSEFFELFTDLQNEVHAARAPLMIRFRDKTDRKIISSPLEATDRYALHLQLMETPRGESVCHGDFVPSNVILSADGTPYILDWSHASRGNAAADAANTYLSFLVADDVSAADEYLMLYLKKSGTDKRDVLDFLPLVACAKLAAARTEEREKLLTFIPTADNRNA